MVTDADDSTKTDSATFSVIVSDTVPGPTLTNPGTQNWERDSAESITIAISGGSGTIDYVWQESIPGVVGSGRTLSGTPTAAGTYPVTLTATDDNENSDSVTFNVVVSAPQTFTRTIKAVSPLRR